MSTLPASGVGSKSSRRNSISVAASPEADQQILQGRRDLYYAERPRPVPESCPGFDRADHQFSAPPKRDAALAKGFFRKEFANPASVQARLINVDKNPAYPAAIKELKGEGVLRRRCRVRRCKYLTNNFERGHRTVKRRT
jgi:hypothetical protein